MGYLEDKIGLRFAETMLYWRGEMRAHDVQQYLGVSERTARTLIGHWRSRDAILPRFLPGKMRSLVPPEGFSPSPEVQDTSITLALLLNAEHFPANPFVQYAPPAGGHDLSLTAKVRTKALRTLMRGCLERKAVFLVYFSKSGKQELVFSPSALVRARGRYHFRGYRSNAHDVLAKQLEDRYVDIVPARVLEAWWDEGLHFVDLKGDRDWHEMEEHCFVLSTDLTEEEWRCYEHEYGIAEENLLKVCERRALMPYIRQELFERLCWRRDGTAVKIWATDL